MPLASECARTLTIDWPGGCSKGLSAVVNNDELIIIVKVKQIKLSLS